MPRPKKQPLHRDRLAELYNQLQAVMPMLKHLVEPEEVREAAQPYTFFKPAQMILYASGALSRSDFHP